MYHSHRRELTMVPELLPSSCWDPGTQMPGTGYKKSILKSYPQVGATAANPVIK